MLHGVLYLFFFTGRKDIIYQHLVGLDKSVMPLADFRKQQIVNSEVISYSLTISPDSPFY